MMIVEVVLDLGLANGICRSCNDVVGNVASLCMILDWAVIRACWLDGTIGTWSTSATRLTGGGDDFQRAIIDWSSAFGR